MPSRSEAGGEWEIRRHVEPRDVRRLLRSLYFRMRPFRYLPDWSETWVMTAYFTPTPDGAFDEASWRLRQYAPARLEGFAMDRKAVIEFKSGGRGGPRSKLRRTIDPSRLDVGRNGGWRLDDIMAATVPEPPPPYPDASGSAAEFELGADTLFPRFATSYRRFYFMSEDGEPVRGTFDDAIAYYDISASPPTALGQMEGAQLELKGGTAHVERLLADLAAGDDPGISKRARGLQLLGDHLMPASA